MLSAIRRHHHQRVNQRYSEKQKWIPSWRESFCKKEPELIYCDRATTWRNQPGLGKWYKRRLHKAERRYAKAVCRGLKGKEPVGYRSEISWKGT